MTTTRPGDITAVEPLVDIMTALHADRRDAMLADIARRKESGAALDDDTRWPHVLHLIKGAEAHAVAKDTAAIRSLATELLEATSSFLEDPGPLAVPPAAHGISISMRILHARPFRALAGKEHRALKAQLKMMKLVHASPDDEPAAIALELAGERTIEARRAFVTASLAEVHIDGQPEPTVDDAVLDTLERLGLLRLIYEVCSGFQDLPWGKGERSGSRPQATSSALIAASAPKESTPPADVTAAA